ncbi:MAG: hypothetical protein RXR43_08905 [Sulfolobus sp.]
MVYYVSSNKKVIVEDVKKLGDILVAKGKVASSSRKGLFHNVEIVYSFQRKYLIGGVCDCEISQYYGICRHQVGLLYVVMRNRKSSAFIVTNSHEK